jgi:vacuolar-type H+-ATPase subunit I/STV1
MRFSPPKLAILLSFLTGLFWAVAVVGFFTVLFSSWSVGVFYAIVTAFISTVPGILGVVIIEYIINSFEQTELLKEQNRLLKEILEKK